MNPPGVSGWALIALGSLLVGCGLAVLLRGRFQAPSEPGPQKPPSPGRSRITRPTRLLIGVLLLMAGFHAIVWAFPPDVLALQLSRRWWWIWLGVGALLVLVSLGLDRLDRRTLGGGPPPAP